MDSFSKYCSTESKQARIECIVSTKELLIIVGCCEKARKRSIGSNEKEKGMVVVIRLGLRTYNGFKFWREAKPCVQQQQKQHEEYTQAKEG